MSSGYKEPTRLVVLISGNGTNLQAIIDACSTGNLPSTKIVRVICKSFSLLIDCCFHNSYTVLGNRKNAFGIKRAQNAQIPWTYHNIIPFRAKNPGDEKAAKHAFDDEYGFSRCSKVL